MAAESTVQPGPLNAEEALLLAVERHQSGQVQEAERLYRAILQLQPNHPDANHNLGVLAVQVGQAAVAAHHFRVALEANHNRTQFWLSYVDALIQTGQLDLARQMMAQGRQLGLSGLMADALSARLYDADHAAPPPGAPSPQEVETLTEFFKAKHYEQAATLAQAITQQFPLHGFGWKALGAILNAMGRSAEAMAPMQRALSIMPDDAGVHSNLGHALKDQGRLAEAEASLRTALRLNPGFAEAYNNLGYTLKDQGRPVEAEIFLRRAVEINPRYAEAHNNLGNTHKDRGQLVHAEACYRQALSIKPDYEEAHNNLGVTLQVQGRLAEAETSLRKALEIKPDFAIVHSNLIFLLDLVEGRGVVEHQAERRRWYEQHGRGLAGSIKPYGNTPDPDRRLRVGYVSADFRRHSAYYIFSPIILHHNREAFEVFCYSGVVVEDDATARLRQAAHVWRSTVGVPDDALAEQIRRDGIDILVDLSGHSAGNRLLMFAHKPAPVQVTAWGYATGTGLETIDYFLADPVVVPQQERSLYAEEVVDLPCVFCYEPPGYLPEVSPLPALGGRPFTFGCINRIEKITDRVIALWGRVFAALPEAQLVLKDGTCDDEAVRQQLLARLGAAGIAAERVRILGHSQHAEHLRVYQEIDAGLDPFPHGGGISTAEALAMGVPVVSLRGDTIASRLTSSALTVLGIPEWIASTEDEYVQIAVRAARDIPKLALTRANLRARLTASPLGNVKHYTLEVEDAFHRMWQKWCGESFNASSRQTIPDGS